MSTKAESVLIVPEIAQWSRKVSTLKVLQHDIREFRVSIHSNQLPEGRTVEEWIYYLTEILNEHNQRSRGEFTHITQDAEFMNIQVFLSVDSEEEVLMFAEQFLHFLRDNQFSVSGDAYVES